MTRVLALVESPAQLLNAVEWGHVSGEDVHIVQLAPTDGLTRFQMQRVAEHARKAGFEVGWSECRIGFAAQPRALAALAPLVRAADKIVIGDPFSGLIQLLLNVARSVPIVVVDDGTATVRYAEQWASGAPLVRWHLARRKPGEGAAKPTDGVSKLSLLVGRTAFKRLGNRSTAVSLFTAMPVRPRGLPVTPNEYAWVRSHFAEPEVLPGTDLMGSSLVESGVVQAEPYLAGVARLVAERDVRRYLPHRKESAEKLRRIEDLGVELVRPDLPMEMWARANPIGSTVLSFPSTVLITLPLVLDGLGVSVEKVSIDDGWFAADAADSARDFVRDI